MAITNRIQNFSERRPAVFFDRDGTLNEDQGYPHKEEDLALIPGAAKAVRRFNAKGYLISVITNQSGIARGYFSADHFNHFNAALRRALLLEGAQIDLILHCPHHPKFSGPCSCRKPQPGMIHTATERLPIDLGASFLIGDQTSDLACATAAGIHGHLSEGGDLHEFCNDQDLFK